MDEEEDSEHIPTDEEGSKEVQATRNANRRYRDAARNEDSFTGIVISCLFNKV